jgi:hypothetical protein
MSIKDIKIMYGHLARLETLAQVVLDHRAAKATKSAPNPRDVCFALKNEIRAGASHTKRTKYTLNPKIL